MDFKAYKVNPKGRNRHGDYYSTNNLSQAVTYSRYGGNISTETIGDTTSSQGNNGGVSNPPTPPTCIMLLVNPQGNFDGRELATGNLTAQTRVLAYTGQTPCPCYIGDLNNSSAPNYGISGIPANGMSVTVLDNGTSATTLQVVISNALEEAVGTLDIPCHMPCFGEEGMDNDWYCWHNLVVSGNGLYSLHLSWDWHVAFATPGPEGRPGPAIRGPYNWDDIVSDRRFCNGEGPNDEDKQWIDILLKDGDYYKCNTSYDGHASDTWASVSSAWTLAEESYDFIAADLLLAENAKIKFLTNNALYLMSGSSVTGGAQGGSGDTIAFWAGASTPGNAPFQVSHNGEFSATTGHFGFMQIGNGRYGGGSSVNGSQVGTGDWEGTTNDVQLNPQALWYRTLNSDNEIITETIIGAPTSLMDYVNAPFQIDHETMSGYIQDTRYDVQIGGYQHSKFYAQDALASVTVSGLPRQSLFGQFSDKRGNGSAILGIGALDLRVMFICDSPVFMKCTNTASPYYGYWIWTPGNTQNSSGVCTGIDYTVYPYSILIGGSYTGSNGEEPMNHWAFSRTDQSQVAQINLNLCKLTGIQKTTAQKIPGIIYIQVSS